MRSSGLVSTLAFLMLACGGAGSSEVQTVVSAPALLPSVQAAVELADASAGQPFPACSGWDSWPDDALKTLQTGVARAGAAELLASLDTIDGAQHPGVAELRSTAKYAQWRKAVEVVAGGDEALRVALVDAAGWRAEREHPVNGALIGHQLVFQDDGTLRYTNTLGETNAGTWKLAEGQVSLTVGDTPRIATVRTNARAVLLQIRGDDSLGTLAAAPFNPDCWQAF